MSGHSKWSTIKRQKGINDSKRGAVFTKLGNLLASAAKTGTDPAMNPTLAMIIDKAKAANMPMSNIERAIARVSDKNAAVMQEVLYEGYAQGGVGVLVECATDNLNRTYPEVKHAFNKTGGSIAEKGAVGFQFSRKGIIRIAGASDELTLQALDAGADDVSEQDGESIVYTEPKDLMKVRGALIGAGIKVIDAELGYIPNSTIEVDDETGEKIMKLLEALEDLDDVITTYTNLS
jgi:YebC/PmpR family DNA-binding regulatory protein